MDFGFAVLAHSTPNVCLRLIGRLLQIGDVYLHVDAKARLDDFLMKAKGPHKLILAEKRWDIRWGSFAMMEATLNMLAQMQARGGYDRYTLLSGDSYPIKSDAEILDVMGSADDFMHSEPCGDSDPRKLRIREVFAPDTTIGEIRAVHYERFIRYTDAEDLYIALRLLRDRKAFADKVDYHVGSQWWSLTRPTLERILAFIKHDTKFTTHFRFSSIPDEAFFQTAIRNCSHEPVKLLGPPIYAKWDAHPRPYVFNRLSDYDLLSNRHEPWARKFGPESDPLLDLLDKKAAPSVK